jgi:hypothetical protein
MPWIYEENPDRKHKRNWDRPEPGFVRERGGVVGKCPTSVTIELAEMLLNNGIEYFPPRWPHRYPQRIYNIHDGQLYRGTPTNPGTSYHGFPENPADAQELPRGLKNRILELARQKDCEAEVRRCLSGK